jgi:hypothetical protein
MITTLMGIVARFEKGNELNGLICERGPRGLVLVPRSEAIRRARLPVFSRSRAMRFEGVAKERSNDMTRGVREHCPAS